MDGNASTDPISEAGGRSEGDGEGVSGDDRTTVTRRTVLKGAGVAGIAAGLGSLATTARAADPTPPSRPQDEWAMFARQVRAGFRRMRLVGGAVAVVTKDRVLHSQPLGVRDLRSRRAVTTNTHFLVASTTKSMSSLLAATHVDQDAFGWDDLVGDVWSSFRAPTDELTRTFRVRDLFGMASGLEEAPALSATHQGDPTAPQLLQSMVNLRVAAPPNTKWIYNNTVYAVGGYLPLLRAGVSVEGIAGAYPQAMKERVYGPAEMSRARIADDPRGLVINYARGHGPDLSGSNTTLAYGPVGSYAPVGGTLATLDDMAAYVQLQLRRGEARSGRRVVSVENLTECWKPHIPVPISPTLDPDATSSEYGMGWITNRYRDGTSLVWHTGGIDGFTTYIGFFPEHDLGVIILNSMNPFPTGTFFYLYVLNLILTTRFGLNDGVAAQTLDDYDTTMKKLRDLGRQSRLVATDEVERYLGYYEGGYLLTLQGRELLLRQGPRVMPVRALPDGTYVISGGLLVQQKLKLRRDTDGTPTIELVDLETVRRTVSVEP